jgi:hypothetical protein
MIEAVEWKDIPGLPGYQVSDSGQVKRLVPEKTLDGNIDRHGYRRHNIKGTCIYVHRLVLSAFIGPCPPGHEGCHNDGDKLNNSLSNLRWGTRSANTWDKINHGTHPFTSRDSCKSGHPYTPENTRVEVRKSGHRIRVCRECDREKARRHRASRLR